MTQRSSTTAFAKSTRPELAGVVPRDALFARLDGTPARTLAWISAPPGFGKTTLAASYVQARSHRWAWYQLDADDADGETFFHYLAHATRGLRAAGVELPVFGAAHHSDVAAFARRFFRALAATAQGPFALVLDNLALPDDGPLRAIVDAGVPQLSPPCCVIVTSRAPPPVSMARLRTSDRMVCLTADDLKFTPPELAEMARLRGHLLAPQTVQQLHGRADGWAAALVLMVEHLKLVDNGLAAAQEAMGDDATPRAVFDYLAGEIFDRFEPAARRLLLQLGCLPRVGIEVACALSGDESAARVLFNLAHNDYLVRELCGPDGRLFVFHPLLREFLARRAARDLPQAVGPTALRRAARLLRVAGQPEDALALLVACKDWPDVAAIAAHQAAGLLAQGRHATLAAWLELLPTPLLDADPALLQSHGLALAQASPRLARRSFERGFEGHARLGNAHGMAACCVGAIDAMLREFDDLAALDRWLTEFDRHGPAWAGLAGPPAAVQVARLWRGWAPAPAGAPARAADSDDPLRASLARAMAATLRGDAAAGSAIAGGAATSARGAAGVALALCNGLRHLVDGNPAAALAAARSGLQAAADEAAHGDDAWLHLLCAAAALGLDDADAAHASLQAAQTLPLRRGDRAALHHLQAELARSAGDTALALREARSAAQLALEAGLPWLECITRIVIAQLLGAADDSPGAQAQLRSAQALAQRLASPPLQLAALLTRAALDQAGGGDAAALASLQAAFALARDGSLHGVAGLPRAQLALLCALALRQGVAVDQARRWISAGKLPAPPAALRLRQWPWAFHITTLGGFALQRAGVPVAFSTKGPGRPVELLKVLVALGGQNVRVDHLADALWPHVDADYAHKSFTATLHRLRRMLGNDAALHLRDGRLSLDAGQFWLDTWALEQLLDDVDASLRAAAPRAGVAVLQAHAEELLALYRGPFLSDEDEQPAWTAKRESLRARVLRALTRVARRWEDGGQVDAAIDCHLRCVAADELCEAFHRNLMLCHQRQGDAAEARAVYARLQTVLAARLRTLPSAETRAVYERLEA